MQVSLPPELESMALQAAKVGGYHDVTEFIAEAVRRSAASIMAQPDSAAASTSPPEGLSYSQWRERFDQFLAHRQPTNPHFDDSRESIYLHRP